MSDVRRTRVRPRAPRRIRSALAAAVVGALALGLLATPLGAVAAPTPSATPTATPEPPAPTPEPEPEPTVEPSPEPSPAPEPSAPQPSEPEPAPAPSEDAVEPAQPEPSPSGTPDLEVPVAPAPQRPSLRQQARDFGIMAAGVAEDPLQVWTEPFTGSSATGVTQVHTFGGSNYAGDAFWYGSLLNSAPYANCNGLILTYNITAWNTVLFDNCSTAPVDNARLNTRRLSDVLGQVGIGVAGATTAAGASATSSTTATLNNYALVEWTSSGSGVAGATSVIARQSAIAPTGVAAGSRFYAASIDLAEASCSDQFGRAQLTLSLGNTTSSSQSSVITACTDSRARFYTSPLPAGQTGWINGGIAVRAGRFVADNAQLLTAAQVADQRPTVRNLNLGSAGNDFAIDNLRVVDVSPSIDIPASGTAVAGVPTAYTYTITNTTELGAKNDWAFVNTLPQGLTLSGGLVSTTCGNGALVTDSNPRVVSFAGGDLAAGTTSCTVTVNVVADAAGTYTNNAAAFGTLTGLIGPDAGTLTATAGSQIILAKSLGAARTAPTDQWTLSVRQGTTQLATATTTGTGTTVGYTPSQVARTVTPGQSYTINETPVTGAGLGYAASYSCVRSGTVIAAGQSPGATITVPAGGPADIVCTFTNTPQSTRLACNPTQFYAVAQTGALTQADIVTGAMTTVGSWTAANANGLGIGANGAVAYALERSATDAGNIASILKWSPTGGFQALANTAYTTVAGGTTITGSIVAGTVDLANNRYLFGKFSGGLFYIWSYTEATNAYAFVGSFSTGSGPNGNGDMAFDSRGNLYVAGSATVGTTNSAAIYTISAASLAAAAGGTIPVNPSTTRALTGTDTTPALGSINGIAFSPRGTAYLSSSTGTYEFDPTTWARIPGSPSVPPTGTTTDLSSCSSPSTVTLLKNVVGRAAAADQFTLTLASAGSTVATATTTGAATGRQTVQIGPYPAPIGTQLTISEAMAAGSTSLISSYTTVYECWLDGTRIATGTTASGTVTMPNQLNANVVCTYFNSPRPASTVTLTKQIQGTTGTTPGAGWTLGTTATATSGTATVLPSEAPQQQSDAAGNAVWTVLFGSTTSAATLVVSEVQQSGFVFVSGSCTVNGTARAVSFTTSGGVVSGSITGVTSASTVACTFVNRPVAALTLVKRVDNGPALPTDWTLSATAPTAPAGSLPGPVGLSGTAATTGVSVTPGVPYRLAETGSRLTYVQNGAWVCATSTGTAVPVTAAGDVTLTQGTSVTCTVANATASLTLVKQVQNPQPGFQAPNWTLTATPAPLSGGTLPTQSRVGAEYVAGGNAANTFIVRPDHTYTLSEAPTTAGSRLAYRELRLERLDGTTWTPLTSYTITAPAAGGSAIYRFVNAPVQPLALPLTGGASADTFVIAGGVVLALALAVAVFSAWRRTRRRLL